MPKHEWYSDTDPKAFEVFLASQRWMTPSENIRAVFERNRIIQALAEAQERENYPQPDDRGVFLRVLARRLDRETMLRVYGWHPDPVPLTA
jgi:hypothetical protein